MDGNDLLRLGYRPGHIVGLALKAAKKAQAAGSSEEDVKSTLLNVLNMPESYADDAVFGQVAGQLIAQKPKQSSASQQYDLNTSAPYRVWGSSQIEPGALDQLKRAVRLPVAVRGALMPDAHQGYGLPIGGVLATWNSVIPYAVGVDIACRMRLTVFDAAPYVLEQKRDKFRKILEEKTRFGTGSAWAEPRDHEIMNDPAWSELSVVRRFKDIAWQQLGTSGSGNHFVEFGALKVGTEIDSPLGKIPPGNYLALLSHSGSRRLGTEIANHYTDVAMQQRSHLPKDFLHLAWLDLNTDAGGEYWAAMTLAGKYASANHAVIHRQIIDALRFPVLGGVENHHNYAWRSSFDGEEVIVHRKGATPAGENELGVIPGSMNSPGYVVRGKGNSESLNSAAHGAGRRMSRSEAKKKFEWGTVRRKLKQDGVDLLSAGLDEVPGAYKDIRQVMSEQADLVEELAEFQPRMVKMAGEGQGRPED